MRSFLAGCAAALLFAGCTAELSREWQRVEPPRSAIDFTLPQLDGPPVSLASLRGRIVIMDFWTTWCGPCRYSSPSLDIIYRKYKGHGVSVLLVNVGEPPEEVKAWAKGKYAATILLDQDTKVSTAYGVSGIPRLFILDREGRVIYDHAGYGGGLEQSLKLILDELLTHGPRTDA